MDELALVYMIRMQLIITFWNYTLVTLHYRELVVLLLVLRRYIYVSINSAMHFIFNFYFYFMNKIRHHILLITYNYIGINIIFLFCPAKHWFHNSRLPIYLLTCLMVSLSIACYENCMLVKIFVPLIVWPISVKNWYYSTFSFHSSIINNSINFTFEK